MINSEVIDRVHEFREDVLDKIKSQDVVSFKINDIEFDDNLMINDTPISDKALKKVFTALRVHNDFFSTYQKALDNESWEDVKYNLKTVKKDTEFFGKKILDINGKSVISDLYKKNEIITNLNIYNTFDDRFRMIEDALGQSDIPYSIKELSFLPDDENVIIRLLNDNAKIDVFNNDIDIWKKGLSIDWTTFDFDSSLFFERLICSNGMSTKRYGFNTNIQKKSFDPEKIEKTIYKMLITSDDKYDEIIKTYCSHLKSNNISVGEFKSYKDFFIERNKEKQYEHILNSKVFDETDIFKAYGDINDKSGKWLSTANSGRNAYDFFNNLTALASHPSHFGIAKEDALVLQKDSSVLFFKENLDLEDIAPSVNFNVTNPFPDSYSFN